MLNFVLNANAQISGSGTFQSKKNIFKAILIKNNTYLLLQILLKNQNPS